MRNIFKLNHPIAENVTTRPQDVLAAKRALNDLGFYEPPEWGITPYPDHDLIDAVQNFQQANGLRVDGVMKPGGETEVAIQLTHIQANRLQGMGRRGDSLLAHIPPRRGPIAKNQRWRRNDQPGHRIAGVL